MKKIIRYILSVLSFVCLLPFRSAAQKNTVSVDDELGKFHQSGHHYKIPYWEVLNEPDLEHNISPQLYTKMYDAIVSELKKISPENLAGAMYAHIFLELTKMGIDAVGESQLVGYPTQFPDVSMVNWENGNPNARYWVLKLLIDNFHSGDKLVKTNLNVSGVAAQAFVLSGGGKRILLINKKNTHAELNLPKGTTGARISYVDIITGENPPSKANLLDEKILLEPFAVAVVELL
jgi:hypothetical protein